MPRPALYRNSLGTNHYSGASRVPAPCVRHNSVGSLRQRTQAAGGPVGGLVPGRTKARRDAAIHAKGNAALNKTCRASAATAFGTGGSVSPLVCRAICNAIAAAEGAAAVCPIIPGTTRGFSHQCSPSAGAPARNPLTLPPNATMARDSSGQSACPGPMPRRRHIQAIERPNWPRYDAASACAEPAGKSVRLWSSHHGGRREQCRRPASKCSRMKRISRARQWTSQSGICAISSGPTRSASGA